MAKDWIERGRFVYKQLAVQQPRIVTKVMDSVLYYSHCNGSTIDRVFIANSHRPSS